MRSYRSLDDLHPEVKAMAEALIGRCREAGIDLVVVCTYRDMETQATLYASGRHHYGRRRTGCKPGKSWHNWRLAFDVLPLVGGKAIVGKNRDDQRIWENIGVMGEACGLEWGGRWKRFREREHFQYTAGLTLADLHDGRRL